MTQRTYATTLFPCFVCDYVGREGMTLTRSANTWTLTGHKAEVSVHARSACEARLRLARLVSRLDGKDDKRRRQVI